VQDDPQLQEARDHQQKSKKLRKETRLLLRSSRETIQRAKRIMAELQKIESKTKDLPGQ
jgi:hypothetical protein